MTLEALKLVLDQIDSTAISAHYGLCRTCGSPTPKTNLEGHKPTCRYIEARTWVANRIDVIERLRKADITGG